MDDGWMNEGRMMAGCYQHCVLTTETNVGSVDSSRNKTGILGWRSEKMETINGYEAKVTNHVFSTPSGVWMNIWMKIRFLMRT